MSYRFATAAHTLLPLERARVLRDGTFDTPKISHPEGVAIGPDGWIWCGNQDGDILRISPDGGMMERVASTGGFALGMAFDGDRALYVCDQRHAAVFRLSLRSGRLERFTAPGIRIPNYPLVDHARRRLLVSDSFASGQKGPGVWSYDLETGEGALWYDHPMDFANGLAMRRGEGAVFVCETFACQITRIAICADGSAGEAEIFCANLPGLPDGIAAQDDGSFVVGCYEPSRLLRISPDGRQTDVLIEDPTAHVFCHPTNIALDGPVLYAANLGRWHITRVETDTATAPLWKASL